MEFESKFGLAVLDLSRTIQFISLRIEQGWGGKGACKMVCLALLHPFPARALLTLEILLNMQMILEKTWVEPKTLLF